MLRKCIDCGLEATNEVELELFIGNKPSKHGRANICKTCHLKRMKEYSETDHGKTILNKSRRKWEKNNPELFQNIVKEYRSSEHYKKLSREYVNNFRAKYPEKIHAQSLARRIPLNGSCGLCGTIERLERHHPDYSKPREIQTLCKPCHVRLHAGLIEVQEI